jgi:hypothetical protein
MCSESHFTKNDVFYVVCKNTNFGVKKAFHETIV